MSPRAPILRQSLLRAVSCRPGRRERPGAERHRRREHEERQLTVLLLVDIDLRRNHVGVDDLPEQRAAGDQPEPVAGEVAVGLELDVIAAVVIGGGSLSGGEGSILGTIVGALIMTVIASGCTQMGLANYWQEIITGAIIVVAVVLDRLRYCRAV